MFTKSKPSQIEALKIERDRTASRLNTESAAFETARVAASEAAAKDDHALDKAVDALRRSELRKQALADRLAQIEHDIERAETEARERADMEQRQATAAEIEKMATGIDAAVSPIMASLQTGLDALRAGEPIFGAVRLAEVFTELLAQLPSAMAVFSNECKQAAAATIDKRKPPRISIAPPALVISPVQEPPAEPPMTIVLTKPCRWKVPVEGTMEVAQRGDLVSWPESRAKRAIELGAAVLPGTEIAKMHQTARMGRTYPDPTMTVDLDTGFLPPGLGGPPLVDEPVNIRAHEKPRTVIIPRAEINQMQRGADEPPDGAA